MFKPLAGIEGMHFGRLTAIREIDRGERKGRHFLCRCECGLETEVALDHLRSGHTKSCGCHHREVLSASQRTHGESRGPTPEYRAWKEMIKRCENQRCERYPKYGGRGIFVCERWRHSFQAFLSDVGRRPSPTHSIHRINNDGSYSPDNVRWETKKAQAQNTSRSVIVEIQGIRHCVAKWCELRKISKKAVYARIRNGQDPVSAILIPIGPSHKGINHEKSSRITSR